MYTTIFYTPMTPEDTLIHYSLPSVREIKPVTVGLIHATYKVEVESDSVKRGARGATTPTTYILQRLHPMLAHPSLTEDYEAVTEALAAGGLTAQRVVRTAAGELTVPDDESSDRSWRLLTYVPGRVYETLSGATRARECGGAVGQFHVALARMPYTFKSALKFHPYNAPKFYKDFVRVTKKFEQRAGDLFAPVKKEVEFLLRTVPKFFLPAGVPKRVVHGDLKITNFVFDEAGRHVRALIDLDTCAKFPIAAELGDAMRSWCGRAEDDPHNSCNKAIFQAAVDGYCSAVGDRMTPYEKKLIPQGAKLITINQALRFLKDYFEDFYFGYDTKKYKTRRAANLARARGQLALFRDMEKKI